MTIDNSFIISFSNFIKHNGVAEKSEDSSLSVFSFSELSVVFKKERKSEIFYGMNFEALGNDYVVLPDNKIYQIDEISGWTEIVDKKLLSHLETFLQWRLTVLKETSL